MKEFQEQEESVAAAKRRAHQNKGVGVNTQTGLSEGEPASAWVQAGAGPESAGVRAGTGSGACRLHAFPLRLEMTTCVCAI